MGSKFAGIVGIAKAADATTIAAPKHYLQCASAVITGEPIVYEQDSNIQADPGMAYGAGHNYSFAIDGIEAPIAHLGYLLWLMLGTEGSYSSGHVLSPGATQDYCCIQIDRGFQIGAGGSDTTEILLGAKLNSLKIEVPKQGFAKCSIAGVGCDLDTPGTNLSASIPAGADNAPISWQAMKDGAFKLGYPGSPAEDNEIQRFAIDITREMDADAGVDLDADQPTGINEGKRSVTFEVDKQFSGNAKTAYDAWLNQTEVGLDVLLTVGAFTMTLVVVNSMVTGSFAKEIGSAAESVMATLQCKANRDNSAVDVLSSLALDGVVTEYT